MISFIEFFEALTPQGRHKKRRTIQKYRYKLKRRASIATGISVSTRRLKRRASLAAKRALYKKFMGVKNKKNLSSTQRAEMERVVKNKGKSYIKSLSARLQPKYRKLDTSRLTKTKK
jgi:hypothetical protein